MKMEEAVQNISVQKIIRNRFQPRVHFDLQAIEDLAQSIKEHGLLQPIVVRKVPDGQDCFELIAGERRLRAVKLLGWEYIQAIVRPYSHVESMQLALIDNIQRENLNPIEEAVAYKALAEQFALSHESIARKLGKSRTVITNSIRLLQLPEEIKEKLAQGALSVGQVRPLLVLEDEQLQLQLSREIKEQAWTARKVESTVQKLKKRIVEHPTVTACHLSEIEEELIHFLGNKVKINGNENAGVLEIAYYSPEDLERLLAVLHPSKYGG